MQPETSALILPSTIVRIRPKQVVWTLAAIAGGLVLAHLAAMYARFGLGRGYIHGLVPLFDLDQERNVPAAFSSLLFLIDGALLAAVAEQHKLAARPYKSWVFLAWVFCFLGVDEFVSIHEEVGAAFASVFHVSGIFAFAWVIPYSIALVVLAIVIFPLLRSLDRRTFVGFSISAAVFLAGALGMEMACGPYFETVKAKDLGFALFTTVEEPLEMAGLILFAHHLLSLLRRSGGFAARIVLAPEGADNLAPRDRA